MHEATRRILSVILQNIEGFKQGSKNVLVCATNRKQVSGSQSCRVLEVLEPSRVKDCMAGWVGRTWMRL